MKRIIRNNTSIIKPISHHKPHDGIRRLLTSTPGAILGLILFSIVLQCNTNSASATTSTLSLSIDNSTVSMSVSPTNVNGSFNKSSASTISASTNNATGYTLSIAAPSSSGSDYDKLINGSDNTAKLNSITEATTESQFKDVSGTSYNGKWGYLPSKYHSQDNSDFLPAPTISGDILDQTSTANSTANNYSLSIGARVDSTVKSGAYTNAFLVTAVANPIPYTIIYDPTIISSMPIDLDTTTMDSSVTLSSNSPTAVGYVFLGWCTVQPTNTDGTDACTGGTTYQPGSTWNIDQTGVGNNLHLYAMWREQRTIANSLTMQEVEACPSTLRIGTVHQLKDTRDNKYYKVAKLADGKCWMVENLDIAGGTLLSNTDTDFDSSYTLPTTNGWSVSGGKLRLPNSSTSGFSTNNYAYVYNSGNTTCGDSPCYSYYSWDAATLGSGRNISAENVDAPYSICPKGWRLPTAFRVDEDSSSDFRILAITLGGSSSIRRYDDSTVPTGAYMSSRFEAYPYNFSHLSGHYVDSTWTSGGMNGRYAASTAYGSDKGLHLYSTEGVVITAAYLLRGNGISVRCLLSD